jgi:hypothetical protein
LSGCSISSSGTSSRVSSSNLPLSFWGCVIAGSVPVQCILWRIMLRILYIFLAWTSGKEEIQYAWRQGNTSVHALLTAGLMFLVSHSHCTSLPEPNSGGTLTTHVFLADRQWVMAIAVRAMTDGVIFSMNDLSLIRIGRMP